MKKVHIQSAMPIFIAAAVWLLLGLIAPKFLLGIVGLLVTAALSALAWFFSRKLFPGRDVEVEEKVTTGDAQLDKEIEEGRKRLENLRKANAAIENPEITRNLDRMTVAGEQIFRELGRAPKKASLVRRFMSYYLPTSEKLMEQYQVLMSAGTKGENIQSAMTRVENSTGIIADAFEKCADNIFASEELDIDSDIQVLKTLMAGDAMTNDTVSSPFKASGDDTPGKGLTLGGH